MRVEAQMQVLTACRVLPDQLPGVHLDHGRDQRVSRHRDDWLILPERGRGQQ